MKYLSHIPFSIAILAVLWSCNVKENKKLRATVDSLKTELNTSMEVAKTLNDVGILIDSIDYNRNLLNTHMIEGTSYNNYMERLTDLNKYVKETSKKIKKLESKLRKSNSNTKQYTETIKKLKKDLEMQSSQLLALQEEVAKVRAENNMLAQEVKSKDEELIKRADIIQLHEENILALEKKVDAITRQSTINLADAYFKQAQALETIAKRTRLAPKRKKTTQREALELYKLSASLGKTEAEQRVEALEKSL